MNHLLLFKLQYYEGGQKQMFMKEKFHVLSQTAMALLFFIQYSVDTSVRVHVHTVNSKYKP